MPISKEPSEDLRQQHVVKRWQERKQLANKVFDSWERRFKCRQNWEWYEGFQGPDAHKLGDPNKDPYIVNMIFGTVEVKIPTLYFYGPNATVVPRQAREDDAMTSLQERAHLREDLLNTFATDPALHLKEITNFALKESLFLFGIVECGYGASFINNPNVGKPILEDDDDPESTLADPDTGLPIMEPPQIPEDEWLYVKRIPAKNFRVSARATHILSQCDWVGYYDYVYASDLRKDPAVINKHKIKATGKWNDDYTGKIDLTDAPTSAPDGYVATDEMPKKQGMVKVWYIWDLRAKESFVMPDEGDYFLIPPAPFSVFPFPALKFHEREEGWYPMPPVFNWKSIQAEYNDTRQKEKSHRGRADRKYQMTKNSLDQENKTALEVGGDMTIVETNAPAPAVFPIEDAPLDAAVSRNVMVTKLDFQEVSAVGSDQRQVADAETATQATVIETRARIRESFGQAIIAGWVSEIMRTMLLLIEEHMTLPMVAKRTIDPLSPTAMMEALKTAVIWEQVTAEQLGPLNYDVIVSAESLSPINEDIERQRFTEVMGALTTNPTFMLMLRTSDMLLRKFLSLNGMRNEKLIQQFKLAIEVALLAMAPMAAGLPTDQGESGEKAGMQAAAATQGGSGQPKNGGGPASAASGAVLPGLPAIVGQISAQMGTGTRAR